MKYVADLHLHSKYSRAVSRDMTLPIMAEYAVKKGINILTTGDFTHPLWFREISSQLEENGEGVYGLKTSSSAKASEGQAELDKLKFILTVEISSIYSQGGKTRRIHSLVFAPNLSVADKINKELTKRGANLSSDGRPIIGLSARNLLELILSIDKKCMLIPCHAWTPWFSLYGSMSGFDSIEECFGNLSSEIYGIETGLSSDPLMNWRIKDLQSRSILSFSDSHSPMKMGREATVFDLEEVSYGNIREAIMNPTQLTGQQKTEKLGAENRKQKTDNRISATFEFYPEEGKYHYTGHRMCKIVQTPEETKRNGVICPVCKRNLTVGVMHRVEQLSRIKNHESRIKNDDNGVAWHYDPDEIHPPFVKLVPLIEIISECIGSLPASQKVREVFEKLCLEFGSEVQVLLKTSIEDIEKLVGPKISGGIKKVRSGDIEVKPGYDVEYGIVKINFSETETSLITATRTQPSDSQIGIDF